MKYLAPEFELVAISANDVITASGDKYEIVEESEGKGNIIFNALNIFK